MLPSLSINSLIRKQQNNLWDDLKLSHCRERSHLRLLSLLLRLHLHLKSSHGQGCVLTLSSCGLHNYSIFYSKFCSLCLNVQTLFHSFRLKLMETVDYLLLDMVAVASRWTFELNLQLLAIVSKPLLQVYNSKWRPKKKKIEDKSSSTFQRSLDILV